MTLRPFIILILCLWFFNGNAQTLLIEEHIEGEITVCDSTYVTYLFTNSYPQAIADARITLSLPAGIDYVAGSITDAQEVDISDLHQPVFQKSLIRSGGIDSITLLLAASCEARVKEGQKFVNRIEVQHSLGKQIYESNPPYSIRTAHLIIEDIHPLDTTITALHMATRFITIQNTRLGRLKQFTIRDEHDLGNVEMMQGRTINKTNTLLETSIGSSDFMKIGNHDKYFDYGERIILKEYISLDSCNTAVVNSDISIQWGCRGDVCQSDLMTDLLVEVKEVVEKANLVLSLDPVFPQCPCDPQEQVLSICNDGMSTATDIELVFNQLIQQPVGILDEPIWLERSGDSIPINILRKSNFLCRSIYDSLIMVLPDIPEGECVKLHFQFTDCAAVQGRIVHDLFDMSWETELKYSTICLEGAKDSTSIRVRKGSNFRAQVIAYQTDEIYTDGDRVSISYTLISKALAKFKHGQVTLYYLVPCGFIAHRDEFVLGGRRPYITGEWIDTTTNERWVAASYKLPYRSDTLNGYLSLELECDTPCLLRDSLVEILSIESECPNGDGGGRLKSFSEHCVSILMSNCPLNDFSDVCGYEVAAFSVRTNIKCHSGDTLKQIAPGYVDFSGKVERRSLGWADEDNNRLPDTPLVRANPTSIDHHKFIEYDTMRLHYTGEIAVDIPGTTFDRLYVSPGVDNKFFEFLRSEIHIVDKSTGNHYVCQTDSLGSVLNGRPYRQCHTNILPPGGTISNAVVLHPSYLQELECVPDDFIYEAGDSIYVDVDYVVKAQTRYTHNTLLPISSNVFIFSPDYDHFPFSCFNYNDTVRIGKLQYNIEGLGGPPSILACSAPNAQSYYHLYMYPGMSNYFPNEYRPLMFIEDIEYTIDPAVTLDSFVLLYYYPDKSGTGPIIHKDLIIPERMTGSGLWKLPMKLDYTLDDGYDVYLYPYISVKDCHDLVKGFSDTTQTIRIITQSHLPYVYFYQLNTVSLIRHLWRNKYEIDPQGSYNLFKMKVDKRQDVSQTDKGVWKGKILKRDSSLEEVRFKIISKTPDLDLVHIRDNLGRVYSEKNGVIIVKPLTDSITELSIIATDLSCDWQYMKIISAWTCDTTGDYFEQACSIDTFDLSVITLPPELEMNTSTSDGPFDLCDTMRSIDVTVWNADRGAAFEVTLDMTLPLGFNLLEDELVYSFDNANHFIPMPKPDEINSGHYRWKLNNLIDQYKENGWPGVDLEYSILTIRVSGTLDCDFGSGSFLHFQVTGRNNCYEPTNTVTRNSDPIFIKNADPSSKFVSFHPSTVSPDSFLCESSGMLTINMFATKPFSAGDKIQIILPSGVRYIQGSLRGISHFKAVPPSIQNVGGRTVLEWNTVEVVDGFVDISFAIELEVDPNPLACGDYELQIQGTHSSKAICITSGEECNVDVVEGAERVPFHMDKGHIRTLFVDSLLAIDSATLRICFGIEGAWGNLSQWSDSLFFKLYQDRSGNGLTDDDVVMGSFSIYDTLVKGDTLLLCYDIGGRLPEDVCHFILEIPDATNCICAPENNSIVIAPPDLYFRDTLCPHASTTIGVSSATGGQYQWEGPDISCTNCPQIEVVHNFNNDTLFNRSYTLTVDDLNGCQQKRHYTVVFLPVISPEVLDYTLCLGDSVELSVKGVRDAVWTGNDPNAPLTGTPVIAHPSESGRWTLTYTDSNDCPGSVPFEVEVLQVDKKAFTISKDTSIYPGGTAHLWVKGPGTFQWEPELTLSCTQCERPDATPDSTTTYTVSIMDENGCIYSLTVTVTILPPPCDPTIVFVPNAFSPNGDGVNDLLFVRGHFIDEIEFVIYDRWGEKVFETFDIGIPWDGTFRGAHLNPDVYSYYLKVKCSGGKDFVKTGNISILK